MRVTAVLVLIFISIVFTDTNISAQEKYTIPQSLDTLPPKPEWHMCWGGNINICKNYVYDKPDDTKIRSNLQSITLDKNQSYNYELVFDEFEQCYDSYTYWGLRTKDSQKDAYGVVTFTDCAGNDTTLYIQYHAFKADFYPKSVDFGVVAVGETKSKRMWIVNKS